MAYPRPTLADLLETALAQTATRLGLDPLLPRSRLAVLSAVAAGLAHGLHGTLAHLARQVIPDTADADNLERWADVFGLARRAASFAAGSIEFTGTDGTNIPAGTTLTRADGEQFETDSLVVIASGTALADVTASTAGELANTAATTQLTLTSPIAGANSIATVETGGIAGGADEETDALLLARLLEFLRTRPQGGSEADYVAWSKEVPGVTRAWAIAEALGAGTVGVAFAVDEDADGPIPDAAQVAEVQAYIDDRRPVTAAVLVAAPVEVELDPEIEITPDTGTVRAAVQASLEDLLVREAAPGGTLYLSHVREAISVAAGEIDHVLVSPVANTVAGAGELITLGTIVWS